MNKKIKILISIVIALFVIGITGITYANSPLYTATNLFPQYDGQYTYYCKERSGQVWLGNEAHSYIADRVALNGSYTIASNNNTVIMSQNSYNAISQVWGSGSLTEYRNLIKTKIVDEISKLTSFNRCCMGTLLFMETRSIQKCK